MERCKTKCRHCQMNFTVDTYNYHKQNYCAKPECRKASKKASQKKWLSKPENHDYFKGPQNCQRVREWRAKNPGYWKGKKQPKAEVRPNTKPLQDFTVSQQPGSHKLAIQEKIVALQDFVSYLQFVIEGFAAQFVDEPLQDLVMSYLQQCYHRGRKIRAGTSDFDNFSQLKNTISNEKRSYSPRIVTTDTPTLQLDRPSVDS